MWEGDVATVRATLSGTPEETSKVLRRAAADLGYTLAEKQSELPTHIVFKKGDAWLANRVYSGVPADLVGLEQVIAVGPMSGKSNVTWFLEKRGVEPTEERVQKVLELAKKTPRLLTEAEILAAAHN